MATTVNADQLTDSWQDAATQTAPDYSKLVSKGFAQDGDPIQGTNATLPGAAWFNLISAMRVSVILAAGLTPETTPNPMQFLKALQSLAWMGDKTILTKLLADDAVTAEKLASNAVETAKIKDAAVTTAKILDGSVTAPKLAANFDINSLPQAWLDALMPAGEFIICAGTTLPPRTLLCNGAAVSRTTYARLFAAIGTKYGAGDGSTTFNLPNVDGRVLQGTSDTSSVGQYLEASLPNITGHIYAWADAADGAFKLQYRTNASASADDDQSGLIKFDASTVNSAYSGSSFQPPAIVALTCIRF